MTPCRSTIHSAAFLSCLAFGAVRPALAVPPGHLWSERFGSTGSDIAYSVAVDPGDNLYVTGAFEGQVTFGATALTSAGNRDMFLAKFASDGSVLWAQGLGGVDNEYGLSVAVGGLGNYVYVTGTHYSMPGLTSAGANDIFVASFQAANGVRVMMKGFGGTLGDAGQSIAITSGDGILITGYFTGSVNFGGGVLNSAGPTTQDVFVVALTGSGGHLWSRRGGGSSTDIGREIARDASDNVFVTGEFRGTADFGGGNLVSAGDSDIFLLKYDAAGSLLWKQRFGNTLADVGNSVAIDGSGGAFITGAFGGTVNFGGGNLVSAGGSDIFLARFDAGGGHQWSARFGGAGSDAGTTVASSAGDVVVGGSIQGAVDFGGGSVTAPGMTDAFVAEFDAAGAHQWSRGMGGTSDDMPQGVATLTSGNPHVVGQFQSTANFGGDDLVSAGDNDMFVTAYTAGPATAVGGTPVRRDLSISSYPNPFNPHTTLRYTVPTRGAVSVRIYDVQGGLVATLVDNEPRGAGAYSIGWDGRAAGRTASSGVYFARVEQAGSVSTKKMVLLK